LLLHVVHLQIPQFLERGLVHPEYFSFDAMGDDPSERVSGPAGVFFTFHEAKNVAF
jgi:hypothetical protein